MSGYIHVHTRQEIRNDWIQIAEHVYAAPYLATNENGEIIFDDWMGALSSANLTNSLTDDHGRELRVASYGEELDVLKINELARKDTMAHRAWTRNMYETRLGAGKSFTRIYGFFDDKRYEFVDMPHLLADGYIESMSWVGAPDKVSDQTNPNFLGARLYYGNNPLLRSWLSRPDASAQFSGDLELSFRLVCHDLSTVQTKTGV